MFSPIIPCPVCTPQKLDQYWKIMDNVLFLPQTRKTRQCLIWTRIFSLHKIFHLGDLGGQKPTWEPQFKCVFGAFQAKQIFHDFLKAGMHSNVRCIKCSDQGLLVFLPADGEASWLLLPSLASLLSGSKLLFMYPRGDRPGMRKP